MGIRFGTMFTGTVDRVGGECIQTRFLAIGVPLIPLGSFFVIRRLEYGFPIALNVKSVFWGYLRWLAFVGVLVSAAEVVFGSWSVLAFAAMTALWVVATFGTTAPGREMAAKRSLFKAATGVSALPQMLPIDVAQLMLDSLEKSPMRSSPAWAFVVASLKARLADDPGLALSAEQVWLDLAAVPVSAAGCLAHSRVGRCTSV